MSRSGRAHFRRSVALVGSRTTQLRLTLVVAPGGCGKTTLATRWRQRLEARDRSVAWLAISQLHRDPNVFLEDFLQALRALATVSKDRERESGTGTRFGDSVDRLLSERTELRPDRVARVLARELERLPERPVLFLDALETLRGDGPTLSIVDQLLRQDPSPAHWVVTTRGLKPPASTPLLAAGDAVEVSASDLDLRADQVAKVLRDEGVEPDPELSTTLLARTGGWAMAVRLAARALSTIPRGDRARFVRGIGEDADLIAYIGSELLGRVPDEVVSLVEIAAVLGRGPRRWLVEAAELDGEPARIDMAVAAGLLVVEGEHLSIHELWRDCLRDRVRERAGRDGWRRLQDRVARLLRASGEGERAVPHLLEALPLPGVEDRIVQLLEREGYAWFARGHRQIVRDALAALPEARTAREPGLIAMRGLLLSAEDPDQAIEHLQTASTAYRELADLRSELLCLYEIAVVAHNENRPAETRAIYRRALSLRRLVTDASARALVANALAAGSFMAGRHHLSLRLVDVARTYEQAPRERALLGVVQAWSCFYQGRWSDAIRRIEDYLAQPGQRQYALGFHAVQVVLAGIEAGRGGARETIRERLEAARDAYERAPYTLNRIRVEHGLALVCRAEDDFGAALEHLETAAVLARRIELPEAEAASLGLQARLMLARGETDEARSRAGLAIDLLRNPRVWTRRWGNSFFWVGGIALACCTLAECGEAGRARRFLERNRRRMRHPELLLCEHTVKLCRARVFDCSGDPSATEDALRDALRLRSDVRLEGVAPELDRDLIDWAEARAAAFGLIEPAVPQIRRPESASAPPLEISSLGGLVVRKKGRRVADRVWQGATSKRLLMRLLAADGIALTRERIEAELWPEAEPASAHNSLSVALHRLRGVLEARRRGRGDPTVIERDANRLGLSADAIAAWDVTRLRAALELAREATDLQRESSVRAAIREANALAQGDFLPESYDDWVLELRFELDRVVVETAITIAATWLERSRPELCIESARLALSRVATDERAWELVVRGQIFAGDRPAARRSLDEARQRFLREFESEPGISLRRLSAEVAQATSTHIADPA